jgi:hypothetical protein
MPGHCRAMQAVNLKMPNPSHGSGAGGAAGLQSKKVILVTEPARLSVTYSPVTWAVNACHLATVLSCYGLVNWQ